MPSPYGDMAGVWSVDLSLLGVGACQLQCRAASSTNTAKVYGWNKE